MFNFLTVFPISYFVISMIHGCLKGFLGPATGFGAQMCKVCWFYGTSTTKWRFYTFFDLSCLFLSILYFLRIRLLNFNPSL